MTMQPIYPLKSGITNNAITRAMDSVKDVILVSQSIFLEE